MAEQLVATHDLAMPDRGHDVPVAELALVRCGDRKRVSPFEMDLTLIDGVHRRAVRCPDVDAEVKRTRTSRDPRVVEVAAHWVRAVERLHRPPVRRQHARHNWILGSAVGDSVGEGPGDHALAVGG